jgi:hypothetical protein
MYYAFFFGGSFTVAGYGIDARLLVVGVGMIIGLVFLVRF